MRPPPRLDLAGTYHDLVLRDGRATVRAGARAMAAPALGEAARRLACNLVEAGLRAGDRLAVQLPTGIEALVAFIGGALAGAVVVPVSTAYREREVAHALRDAGARAVVTGARHWPVVRAVREQAPDLRLAVVAGPGPAPAGAGLAVASLEALASRPSTTRLPDVRPDALALLPYSSGTTGAPKGVMLTHRNLVATLTQFGMALDVGPDDVLLSFIPLAHIYGLMVCGIALAAGAALVLLERYDLEQVLAAVARHRVTLLFAVPPVIAALAERADLDRRALSSLRVVNSGAAPQAPEVIRRAAARIGVPVITGYGLTEAAPAAHNPLPPRGVSREEAAYWSATRPGGVGHAVAGTEMRVVDPESGRPVPAGTPGELWVRGPQVMQGYWNQPAATAAVLVDGWLRTGDLATQDADGYLAIVGRLKDLIKVKGFSVAPAEIEAALREHPVVADCAVTGRADAEHGEVPVAFVVRRPGASVSADELLRFTGDRLAGYKRLHGVHFVEEIPRSPAGKVLRPALDALILPPP